MVNHMVKPYPKDHGFLTMVYPTMVNRMVKPYPKNHGLLTMVYHGCFFGRVASQGHSRSFILQSITGRQGVAYRHVILLALSLTFPKSSQANHQKLPSLRTSLLLDPRPEEPHRISTDA